MIKGLKWERAEPDETAGWRIPGKIEHFEGVIGKMKLSEIERSFFFEKGEAFCNAVRKIGSLLIREEPVNKPALMAKNNLAGREFNLALSRATAMIESAKTILEERREKIGDNISSLSKKIKESGKELAELTSKRKAFYAQRRKKKLTEKQRVGLDQRLKCNYISLFKKRNQIARFKGKLSRAERKLSLIPEKPHVFMFGKGAYFNQPTGKTVTKEQKAIWRREWDRIRNSMFGARGSSDEVGGNSTYRIVFTGTSIKTTFYLGKLTPSTVYHFSVFHKEKSIGKFSLSENEGKTLQSILIANNTPIKKNLCDGKLKKGVQVFRADTEGRTPLKVEFHYQADAWNIHVMVPLSCLPKEETVLGALGIDTNHGHFESCEVSFEQGKFTIGEYRYNRYDIDAPRNEKKYSISRHIRELVWAAKEKSYAIVMENLDWEGGQKSGGKLGATLSAMPYRTILFKVMRECARLGVPFRLVHAAHTSLLGNIMATDNIRLSRDVAAAAIIAMRGLSPRALDAHLKTILSQSEGKLRLNEKGKFSRHITVNSEALSQMDIRCHENTESGTSKRIPSYSRCVGDALSKIARSVRGTRHASQGRILCRPSSNSGKPNPDRYTTSLIRGAISRLENEKPIPFSRVLNFEQV